MKILIAQMEHETNTFSPVPTPLSSFGSNGPYYGIEAYHAMKNTRTPIGAFINLVEKKKCEFEIPIAGFAYPSGPVDQKAYEVFCNKIMDEISDKYDAILLDLHGAMVVKDTTDDAEGTLLEMIKNYFPKIPVGVSLDLHANVTQKMVKNCEIIVGYNTYPHIDMYETGEKVGKILFDLLDNSVKPKMYWENIPILAQTLKMDTSIGAMKNFSSDVRNLSLKKKKILAASSFGGFPMADMKDSGVSCVIVSDNDLSLAKYECKSILKKVWTNKDSFVWKDTSLKSSIAEAKKIKKGPVLLIDHSDNCASGGTQDTMDVTREALDQGLKNIAVGPIRDPQTVQKLISKGIGRELEIDIGGKLDMPFINTKGNPLKLTGYTKCITDGRYKITGPQFTGIEAFMGKTVVFKSRDCEIVITENLQEPWDIGVFTSVGVNPYEKNYLILKSRMYFKPIFEPFASSTIYCAGSGVTSSDWNLFNYKNLRRPIFPLDKFD